MYKKLYSYLKNKIKNKNVNTYEQLKKKLEKEDKLNVKRHPRLNSLHKKINRLKNKQEKKWNSFVYCGGYFYQGYKRIGIHGIKPTEPRIDNYKIYKYLSRDKKVLDIGSNCGWVSCHLSPYSKSIDGIEINPYLVEIGQVTVDFLNIQNVNFINGNFENENFDKQYDVILSLSNHDTIDGNLNPEFHQYIKRLYGLSKTNAYLFFESHNLKGGDSDIDKKFDIIGKYFELIKCKMVTAFFEPDIDKLFAVFKRKSSIPKEKSVEFNIDKVSYKYD